MLYVGLSSLLGTTVGETGVHYARLKAIKLCKLTVDDLREKVLKDVLKEEHRCDLAQKRFRVAGGRVINVFARDKQSVGSTH